MGAIKDNQKNWLAEEAMRLAEDNQILRAEFERLRIENARMRKALKQIIHEDQWTTKHPDGVIQRGQSIFDGYFGGIARAALEEKATDDATT